ncbi:MAG: thiol reductase thioredoxin [Betaproteobacteria bacterium HGW-Betaproteobacteria-12]|nr:MAG: thiol reductase thioredoxin [Betaproteobacteria bacterium HGW-Betaproteobacteria-12]
MATDNSLSPDEEPRRSTLDALTDPILLEFGATWCGYCQAAQPLIAAALEQYPDLSHMRIEDGPGRRLGRSFHVKLWPTLILMHQGSELARLVRPTSSDEIIAALAHLRQP